jgi:hypothetical protein
MSVNKHIQLLRKTGLANVGAAKTALESAFATGKFQAGEPAIAVTNDGEVVLGIQGNTESGSTFYNAGQVESLINAAKSEIVGGASSSADTLGELETIINEIKSGEAEYEIEQVTDDVPVTVQRRYQLSKTVGGTKTKEGVFIDINKDSSIISINYITDPDDPHYQNLEYTYADISGGTQTTYVDMSHLVLQEEFASGVTCTNGVAHGVVDPTSETFLTVGADGFKLSGVQNAINTAVAGLDAEVSQTAGADGLALSITEADGIITALTGSIAANTYDEHGAAATAETNAKAYTDTEIGKLNATESNAKTHVSVSVTQANGKITAVAVTESDIASASGLTAEVTARKAQTGINGDTYAANTSANYISGATSLNDADVMLDAAIKANAKAIEDLEDAKVSVSASTENESAKYLTVTPNAEATVYTVKVSGVDDAITTAVNGLNVETVGASGKFIQSISESKGKISATAADLNATAVAATTITGDTFEVTGTTVQAQMAEVVAEISDMQDSAYSGVTSANKAITVGDVTDNGQVLTFNLDTTSSNNATSDLLSITDNGLKISDTYDCGTWS